MNILKAIALVTAAVIVSSLLFPISALEIKPAVLQFDDTAIVAAQTINALSVMLANAQSKAERARILREIAEQRIVFTLTENN